MRWCGVFVLASFLGCATKPPLAPPTLIRPSHIPETRALPSDPGAKKIPPAENWAVPLEKNKCAEKPGIFVSEAKAVRCAEYKLSYEELRKLYEADRREWTAQRALYEGTFQEAEKAFKKMQPSWYQQHAFELGILSGVVLGVAASVATIRVLD